jgi:hypothetical protein
MKLQAELRHKSEDIDNDELLDVVKDHPPPGAGDQSVV